MENIHIENKLISQDGNLFGPNTTGIPTRVKSAASREIVDCHSSNIDLLLESSNHCGNLNTTKSNRDKNGIKFSEPEELNPLNSK